MILYATKKTVERYGLPDDLHPKDNVVPLSVARETGNPLQEWGAKLFYFDGRKCLQVCNFASKLTLFLFDLKKKNVDFIGELIGFYVRELFCDDDEMKLAILSLFGFKPSVCFSRLTDKRIISTLNSSQRSFALDGDNFYRFIEDGVLDTVEINRCFNFHYPITDKIDGKTQYFMPNERFRELVLAE